MKRVIFLLLVLLAPALLLANENQQESSQKAVPRTHPRLFMHDEQIPAIKAAAKDDPYWQSVDAFILEQAAKALKLPLPERTLIGRRMVLVSRETLTKVFYLSYAYRTTGNVLFAERAENEMLAAAAFEDWNPSHYLDVAEMSAALAIGYDWLYDYLHEESREVIAQAIAEKALRNSLDEKYYKQWNESKNNWNQVCHAGLTLGALAIWERDVELCAQITDRAIAKVTNSMSNYNPDGAYAEGPAYWEYGTLFNVLLLDALQSALGSDYGLIESHPGFQKATDYICNMITPAGNLFNYGDNAQKAGYNIAPFWFAKNVGAEQNLYPIFKAEISRQRLLPLAIIWGHEFSHTSGNHPEELFWVADGEIPVAAMRSAWGDEDAQFVGVKLGTCTVSHSHLDIGSFIYESHGIRWATDTGSEDYTKLEAAQVDLWNRKNGSQRWDVYRYGNGQHNVFTLNSRNQLADVHINFDKREQREDSMYLAFDLSECYTPWAKYAYRQVEFFPRDERLVVSDQITAGKRFTKMEWTLMSQAEPTIVEGGVRLSKDGHSVMVTAECTSQGSWIVEKAEGKYSFDSPNPGVYRIRYTADLITQQDNHIEVTLQHE